MKNSEIYFGAAIMVMALLFAAQSKLMGFSFLEYIEILLEFVNMAIAMIAAVFAWMVADKFGIAMRNGSPWRWLALAAFLFVVVEIIGILNHFGLLQVGGLYEFFELGFIIALTRGFWEQRRVLTDIIQIISRRLQG